MNINKQLQWFLLLIIWGILQIGCADSPYDTDGPQLVVEGWIDAGGHHCFCHNLLAFHLHRQEPNRL